MVCHLTFGNVQQARTRLQVFYHLECYIALFLSLLRPKLQQCATEEEEVVFLHNKIFQNIVVPFAWEKMYKVSNK